MQREQNAYKVLHLAIVHGNGRRIEDKSKKIGELPSAEIDKMSTVLIQVGKFLAGFSKNLRDINDIRFLSIIMHQYIEFLIDTIIRSEFKHFDVILKENYLFSFYHKCALLKALGIFDGLKGKNILINIRIMTRIRNHYAHSLDISTGEIIPDNIRDMVNSMHTFGKLRWNNNDNNNDLQMKYKRLALETFWELSEINNNIRNDNQQDLAK